MADVGHCRGGDRQLQPPGVEHLLQCAGHRRREPVVAAWVIRIGGVRDEWDPAGIGVGGRVAVGVGQADRGARPPKAVDVLGVPDRDDGVGGAHVCCGEHPGGIHDVQVPDCHLVTQHGLELDLGEPGVEQQRGCEAHPRVDHRCQRRGGGPPDPRCWVLGEQDGEVVTAVLGAQPDQVVGGPGAEGDAAGLGVAVGELGQRSRIGAVQGGLRRRHIGHQDLVGGRHRGRLDRGSPTSPGMEAVGS